MFYVKSKRKAVSARQRLFLKFFFCLQLTVYFLTFSRSVTAADNVTIVDVHASFMQKDYAKTKELAQALAAQTEFVQEKAEAFYYAGLSDLWLGKHQSARQLIQQALNGQPTKNIQDMASLALIDSYYMEGDYQKSLRMSQNFIDNHPQSEFLSAAYLKIARCHLKLAHWKEGREALQKMVQKYPNSLERFYVEQLLQESQFFAVQVGSFQDRVTAEGVVAELQKKGEYAYIVETASQEGKKFFRVRVGKFQQFDEAKTLESKLSKLGYPTKIYP